MEKITEIRFKDKYVEQILNEEKKVTFRVEPDKDALPLYGERLHLLDEDGSIFAEAVVEYTKSTELRFVVDDDIRLHNTDSYKELKQNLQSLYSCKIDGITHVAAIRFHVYNSRPADRHIFEDDS
jgi:hypothetical protein